MILTIFTPTYNRREMLVRVYNSLLSQTLKGFEWLIVDDGSTDDTADQVKEWVLEEKIPIRYFYRQNGGKMRAHNTGVRLAKGSLFLCLDSDDYLVDTAVEDLVKCYEANKEKELDGKKVSGVVAHKGISETKLLGDNDFPDIEITTLYGLYLKGFKGETTLLFETQVLRKFFFPEIEGEKYVPEDYVYDKIDSVCSLAVLPKIATVCEIVEKGYTDSVKKLRRNNPKAWYLYYEQRSYITPPGMLRIKYLGRYVIYAIRAKKSLSDSKRISAMSKLVGIMYAFLLIITRKE